VGPLDKEEFSSWAQDRCSECSSLILQLTGGEWVHKAAWLSTREEPHSAVPGLHREVTQERGDNGEPLPGSIDMETFEARGRIVRTSMTRVYGPRFWKDYAARIKYERDWAAWLESEEKRHEGDSL
jgi:hypothetical protein